MPLASHHAVIERDAVIDGILADSDPDAPLIVISKSLSGELIVASTHGAPVIADMLDEAPEHVIKEG